MVTLREFTDGRAHRRVRARWVPIATAQLLLVALVPPGIHAVAFAQPGELDSDAAGLASALQRCPDDSEVLGTLAALHFRQGRLSEAEVLAARLVQVDPESADGWDLLAVTRYLRDDTRGALLAWERGRPPVVRDIEIRIAAYDGPRASDTGADPARIAGIASGRPLTLEGLVRGERRLGAVPAASRARLGYRALPGGEATVDGAVVLRAGNPFSRAGLIAHGFRLVGRRVHLVSADPLGRLEQWELGGTMEGTLRRGSLALAHLAPGDVGVWRWEVDHEVGRYGSTARETSVRVERTGLGWTHTHWVTASLQGSAHARIDVRSDRGTFAGAGMGWTLLPLGERSSITAEGTGWLRIGGRASGDGDPRDPSRFGRMEIRAALHPLTPAGVEAPAGVSARLGVVAVSSALPPDLRPRIGAGGNAALLMRARSDLDGEGVIRPVFPGSAWLHGGVELLRPVLSVGPVGLGVAVFADGVRVLASDRSSIDPAARAGAVHLGAGARARIPGVDGWLRLDWGIDPTDGASRLSAAWVQGVSG